VTVAHRMDWAEFATHLMRAEGAEQNFIEVKQDWSDLPQKMDYFINHPGDAEVIANRSYEVFNQRYLTPAAVSCYLRRLFQGWAKVQGFKPEILQTTSDGGHELRGIPFEALAVSFPQERPGEYGRFASS
jgi:protein glucosyltransferase